MARFSGDWEKKFISPSSSLTQWSAEKDKKEKNVSRSTKISSDVLEALALQEQLAARSQRLSNIAFEKPIHSRNPEAIAKTLTDNVCFDFLIPKS